MCSKHKRNVHLDECEWYLLLVIDDVEINVRSNERLAIVVDCDSNVAMESNVKRLKNVQCSGHDSPELGDRDLSDYAGAAVGAVARANEQREF